LIIFQFREENFELCSLPQYEAQCGEICEDNTGEKSVEYGINHGSILRELQYFDVTSVLLPDVMHDILEGVLQYEMKLFLQFGIQEHHFTFSMLTLHLESFDFGYMEECPATITRQNLFENTHCLKQKGKVP